MTTLPPTIVVRDARPEDADGLGPLLAALGYPVDPGTVGSRLGRLLAADATGRVPVAAQGARLVGFATLHSTPVLHRPTPVGRITAMAVLPAAQGAGVGRLLMRAAEQHFREQGLARVEVNQWPDARRGLLVLSAHGIHRSGRALRQGAVVSGACLMHRIPVDGDDAAIH